MRHILVLLIPLFILSACKEEAKVIEAPVKAVKTITISGDNKGNSRQISGVVKTSGESVLSFRVGGRVGSVDAKIGDKVTKGQVLAQLEQTEYNLAVQSARADLASARADLAQKSEDLKRQQNLKKQDFVAQSAVDQAKAANSAAQSNVNVANVALKNAQRNLDDTILKAPFDGAIAKRAIEPFVEITAGKEVFELQNEDGYKVEVLMPETLLKDVTKGDAVNVTFPTLSNTAIKGKVSEIGAKAETGNAFPVKVELDENTEGLRSGMTAQVSFSFGKKTEQKAVYIIPVTALDVRVSKEAGQSVEGQAPIYIVNNGVAEKRMITIGDIRGNDLEITGGLNGGEVVIVAGVPFLTEGQKVKQWKPTYNKPATINSK